MNFCTVRKWVGLRRGIQKKKVHAHTFLSTAALLYVLHAHLSVAVVSAAQREFQSIRPSDLPCQHTHRRTKRPSGSASRYRSSHCCSALSRVTQETLTLQFLSARPSGSSDPLPNETGPCSSLGPEPTRTTRLQEVLYMIL